MDDLNKTQIFEGLTESEIEKLKKVMILMEFNPGSTIIDEGVESSEMYLIIEGEVEVLKWDDDHWSMQMITKLGQFESFGENAFLERTQRSTTIKAIQKTTVYELDREKMDHGDLIPIRNKIFYNIALINNTRLKNLNTLYVRNLKKVQAFSLRGYKEGRLLVCEILILIFFSILFFNWSPLDVYYYLWFIVLIPTICLVKFFQVTLSEVGLNFSDWKKCLTQSFMTFLILGSIYLLLAWLVPALAQGNALQQNLANPYLNGLLLVGYAFVYEWISKGVLQSSLKELFQDQNGYKTLFLNALLLFIVTLPFGINIAGLVALISLPFGTLYLFQKNILGVFLIHSLLLITGLLVL